MTIPPVVDSATPGFGSVRGADSKSVIDVKTSEVQSIGQAKSAPVISGTRVPISLAVSSPPHSIDTPETEMKHQAINPSRLHSSIGAFEAIYGKTISGKCEFLTWEEDDYPDYAHPTMDFADPKEGKQSVEKKRPPIATESIGIIFERLCNMFGFQKDNCRNMFDSFMKMLDSRSSRMAPNMALATIHANYIGGEHANYKKWYFASGMDLIDFAQDDNSVKEIDRLKTNVLNWNIRMTRMSAEDRVAEVALYLLIWGEANQMRFVPEGICFIFKCAINFYYSCNESSNAWDIKPRKEFTFLNKVVTPLYNFLFDQLYEKAPGHDNYLRKEKDHRSIIGYDDMNQLFWYQKGLNRIVVDGKKLIDEPPELWYEKLQNVSWEKVFFKTYKESRSWLHMILNFNRIWIIHISIFYFYTTFNAPALYTHNYDYTKNNQPPGQVRWTIIALGGAIGPLINLLSTFAEFIFVPRKWPGKTPLIRRTLMLIFCLLLMVMPTGYILLLRPIDEPDLLGTILAIVQMVVAVILSLIFSVVSMDKLSLVSRNPRKNREILANYYFTSAFSKLTGNDLLISYGLWICVFVAKLTESYFFLTLSLRDPIGELAIIELPNCLGDVLLGPWLCRQQANFLLIGMVITDLVLFFLDTYLWYVIFNTLFSVARSFYLGASVWTPWKNVYTRLTKRISSKIVCTSNFDFKLHRGSRSKIIASQVWNVIIQEMEREHLLPIEQASKLVFNVSGHDHDLIEPQSFLSNEDQSFHTALFDCQTEAERRISFFAQSLATPIPEPCAISCLPSFTVLVPHYNEKIMLSMSELIKGNDKLAVLEYMKKLHPLEWDCFVEHSRAADAKMAVDKYNSLADLDPALYKQNLSSSSSSSSSTTTIVEKEHKKPNFSVNDLHYMSVGFRVGGNANIDRLRMWASLRAQTLFRTIHGFMQYVSAINLFYAIEMGEIPSNEKWKKRIDKLNKLTDWADVNRMSTNEFEAENKFAARKFRLLISMQKLTELDDAEKADIFKLMNKYSLMEIAYLDKEKISSEFEREESASRENQYYYSVLQDKHNVRADGTYGAKYRIRLSGNPILGDGKGDNQNHAIIFYRGEYIQLIDANQDNYFEECLKIRSVLAEFEEMETIEHPYNRSIISDGDRALDSLFPTSSPVAIVGAREYIFSENIGVLGDVAAGKEQTFGTLFARTLAKIGGKLHYGHPDFLNTIYMTTRGGVSKAQKGLHLNEDIYAGMNAVIRGGRIKHSEYIQCGKGRDLGFGSILNFTSKIGAGMGEQMLSREYYYLGTRLPLDRFLSFYYAHPGFHINNMFIVVSLELFLIVLLNLVALASEAVPCEFNPHALKTDKHKPDGCLNVVPLFKWVERCVLSIFVVFFISFLPLFVQELTERGFWRSLSRLGKHLASLSPIFEVFVCQIYAQSLVYDLALGGAKYISTGRGFATTRIPFTTLYTRFAEPSMYFGTKSLFILIFISATVWKVSLLWFWITTAALCVAPIIYNPHQFSASEFFLDYRDFIRWLFRGNTLKINSSWISFVRFNRGKITGYKRRVLKRDPKIGDEVKDSTSPKFMNRICSQTIAPLVACLTCLTPYLYINSQNDLRADRAYSNASIRLLVCAFGPILVNAIVLFAMFWVAVLTGLCAQHQSSRTVPKILSGLSHVLSVVVHVGFLEFFLLCENWNFRRTILGVIAIILIQVLIFKTIIGLFLTREPEHNRSNFAWWSGNWIAAELGWMTFTQPFREYICKITEMSIFVMDFTLGHMIFFVQLPIICIPFIDNWHSMMLFWLKPSQINAEQLVFSPIYKGKRVKNQIKKFAVVYFIVLLIMLSVCIGPVFLPEYLKSSLADTIDNFYPGIVRALPPTEQ